MFVKTWLGSVDNSGRLTMGVTRIEWTDRSINPIRARDKQTGKVGHHCEKVSDGCKNCYASALQKRFGLTEFSGPSRRDTVEHFLDHSKLREVLRRKIPTKYFWCDMTDLFGDWVSDEWIDLCFATMTLTLHHTHQVLTKRIQRTREYLMRFKGKSLRSVWIGVSVENKEVAAERIPILQSCPAVVRFLSIEPLLEPLGKIDLHGIDWVIVGGESGHCARRFHLEWARDIIRQCRDAGVACFVKQLGSDPVSDDDGDARNSKLGSKYGLGTLLLRDSKGGDPDEWPADLRVRDMPN